MTLDRPTLAYPEGRLMVIGDIHGCLDELKCLLNFLEDKANFSKKDRLIFIGDYIDRGPDSKGVIDLLINFKRKFPATDFLKGNHEDMLLSFLGFAGEGGSYWLQNGGVETLDSYKIDNESKLINILNEIPTEHINFYRNLKHDLLFEHFVIVHAGYSPLHDLLNQTDEDRFWIREEFIQSQHFFGKTVVFGHTPYQDILLDPPYKIGVDSGLVYGNMLSCVDLSCGSVWQIAHNEKKVKESSIERLGITLDDFKKSELKADRPLKPSTASAAIRLDLKLQEKPIRDILEQLENDED